MPRYVAFLRGVSPTNLRMQVLRLCLEPAGFGDVRTVLSSGNVALDSPEGEESTIAQQVEHTVQETVGRLFPTTVRSTDHLGQLIQTQAYQSHSVYPDAKRVVTFLFQPCLRNIALPLALDDAKIFEMRGLEVFSAYLPNARGPVFMRLIEKTFGKEQTTRTWQTVQKCAAA